MTSERLEELNSLRQRIAELKDYIKSMDDKYDFFELEGRYKGDPNGDYIFAFNNLEKHDLHPLTELNPLVCDGLQELITSFLKEKLAKLEKEFEEA